MPRSDIPSRGIVDRRPSPVNGGVEAGLHGTGRYSGFVRDPGLASKPASAAHRLLLHGWYSERGRSGGMRPELAIDDEAVRWPDSEDDA